MNNFMIIISLMFAASCVEQHSSRSPDAVFTEVSFADARDGTLGGVTDAGFKFGVGGGSLHVSAAAPSGYTMTQVLIDLTASSGAELVVSTYSLLSDGSTIGTPPQHTVFQGGHEFIALDVTTPKGKRLPWQDTLQLYLGDADVDVVLHQLILVDDPVDNVNN